MEPRDRATLDGWVVSAELTLLSIIQGIALYFLTDGADPLVRELRFETWPYIATALVTILLFWSRALLHVLTLLRWPLEFGHNFLYVVCTFFQALLFRALGDPQRFEWMAALFGLAVWCLFAWDMKLVRRFVAEARGPTGRDLGQRILRDQLVNVRVLVPGFVLFYAATALAYHAWPDRFFDRGIGRGLGTYRIPLHVLVATTQFAGALAYLAAVLRFWKTIAPKIEASRAEG